MFAHKLNGNNAPDEPGLTPMRQASADAPAKMAGLRTPGEAAAVREAGGTGGNYSKDTGAYKQAAQGGNVVSSKPQSSATTSIPSHVGSSQYEKLDKKK